MGAGIGDVCDNQSTVVSEARLIDNCCECSDLFVPSASHCYSKIHFLSCKQPGFTSSAAIMYCSNCTGL